MLNLSVAEMLSLWSDLTAAMYGYGFEGSVAELYLYRFGYSPTEPCLESQRAERVAEANESLHALLECFAKHRGVSIKVNGRKLGRWVRTAGFDHRVHVEVGKPKWLAERLKQDRSEGQ